MEIHVYSLYLSLSVYYDLYMPKFLYLLYLSNAYVNYDKKL